METTYNRNRLGDISGIVPPEGGTINFNVNDGGQLIGTSETNVLPLGKPKNVLSNLAVSGIPTTQRSHSFTWGAPDSDLPVVGYSWAFDAAPDNTQDGISPPVVWNNVAVGNHSFQVKAKDSTGRWGEIAVFSLVVVNQTPSELWKSQKFSAGELTDASISGDLADPDKDGILNLTEYCLGTEPKVDSSRTLNGSTPGLPLHQWEDGLLTITYHRDTAKNDVVYGPQWSVDLNNWSPSGFSENILSTTGTIQTLKATMPATTATWLRLWSWRPVP